MEFRAIVGPVSDGLWKSYGAATKELMSSEELLSYTYYAISYSIME